MSPPIYPLWFSEWNLIKNPSTHGLYRRPSQEHITPIELIPDSAPSRVTRQAVTR